MYSEDELSKENLLGMPISIDEMDIPSLRSIRRSKHQKYLWSLQGGFFLISLTLFVASFFRRHDSQQLSCDDHMPMYSPALEAVQNTGYYQRFDGSFETPNAFKGRPSPSIDEHWDSITYADGMLEYIPLGPHSPY